jgi:thienamycin biosynthesis protein ThnO
MRAVDASVESRAVSRERYPYACFGETLPALAGRRQISTYRRTPVRDGRGETIAELCQPPRPLQARMVESAAASAAVLRAIPDDEWFGIFQRAAAALLVEAEFPASGSPYASRVARASGLPAVRVARALRTLCEELADLATILAVQSPDGTAAAYRSGDVGRGFLWLPAGRHVAVRIPGNFPTINTEWLQVVAARRPALLCASPRDPFTPLLLAEALYAAGLPDGAISLCHGEAPAFWRLCDQILWPGDAPVPASALDARRVKRYHQGRSKAVVLAGGAGRETWSRLARLAAQGCGRLCTNVSAVAAERGEEAAVLLAERLAEHEVLPLDDPCATVPAFPDAAEAAGVARVVAGAVARGARDVSAALTGLPLVIERDGLTFLRPTVLRVEPSDPIFGQELPFPFVAVAEVPRAGMVAACRGSLIVSVAGEDRLLVGELALEPTIDKVFHGEEIDRAYRPVDPHEGFIADFLFHKKAVLPRI